MPRPKAYTRSNSPRRKVEKLEPRIAANGHKLPDPLPEAEILTDMVKRQWRLGQSIGLGGFGEIYLASGCSEKTVGKEIHVIKIEPHTNGPLFSEMHFYYRVGKPQQIASYMKQKHLKFLGMPRFIGSGSHESNGIKYRFMVLERFGEDLQKLLERNGRVFPLKTVYSLGIKIIDILEYVHSNGYIHADVKASNLMTGFGKAKLDEVFLIDYGLACKYISHGQHKDYKEDLRKAHDGTMEYTSRDAHIGAHSRRGDLEILGYNMLQWICSYLPWEDSLKDPEHVYKLKKMYMKNVPSLMKVCFPRTSPPKGLFDYFLYVTSLEFEAKPDYGRCRKILEGGLKAAGLSYDGKLIYLSQRRSLSQFPIKRPASRDGGSPPRKILKSLPVLRKMASESAGSSLSSPCRKLRRVASATPRLQTAKVCLQPINEYISAISNPTPAMTLVIKRKLEQLQQAQRDLNGKIALKNWIARQNRVHAKDFALSNGVKTTSDNGLVIRRKNLKKIRTSENKQGVRKVKTRDKSPLIVKEKLSKKKSSPKISPKVEPILTRQFHAKVLANANMANLKRRVGRPRK